MAAPEPGTAARLDSGRPQDSYEKAEFDSSMVEPPAVELQPESEPQAQEDDKNAGEGVYFGGAYTVRCYGVGAEVRDCVADSMPLETDQRKADHAPASRCYV